MPEKETSPIEPKGLLTFEIQKKESYTLLLFKGHWTENGASSLLLEMVKQSNPAENLRFVADFSGILFINSTGIGEIIKLVRLVNSLKGNVIFVRVPSKVKELLDIIRLNSMLSICETEEEALKYFSN
jgi:anti-sigma B factor antagonist